MSYSPFFNDVVDFGPSSQKTSARQSKEDIFSSVVSDSATIPDTNSNVESKNASRSAELGHFVDLQKYGSTVSSIKPFTASKVFTSSSADSVSLKNQGDHVVNGSADSIKSELTTNGNSLSQSDRAKSGSDVSMTESKKDSTATLIQEDDDAEIRELLEKDQESFFKMCKEASNKESAGFLKANITTNHVEQSEATSDQIVPDMTSSLTMQGNVSESMDSMSQSYHSLNTERKTEIANNPSIEGGSSLDPFGLYAKASEQNQPEQAQMKIDYNAGSVQGGKSGKASKSKLAKQSLHVNEQQNLFVIPGFKTAVAAGLKPNHVAGGNSAIEKKQASIPRPSNSFILYRRAKHAEIMEHYKGEKMLNNNFISKIVARWWKAENDEVKKYWTNLADEEKRVHALKYPNYKYKPKKLKMQQEEAAIKAEQQQKTEAINLQMANYAHAVASGLPLRIDTQLAQNFGISPAHIHSHTPVSAIRVDTGRNHGHFNDDSKQFVTAAPWSVAAAYDPNATGDSSALLMTAPFIRPEFAFSQQFAAFHNFQQHQHVPRPQEMISSTPHVKTQKSSGKNSSNKQISNAVSDAMVFGSMNANHNNPNHHDHSLTLGHANNMSHVMRSQNPYLPTPTTPNEFFVTAHGYPGATHTSIDHGLYDGYGRITISGPSSSLDHQKTDPSNVIKADSYIGSTAVAGSVNPANPNEQVAGIWSHAFSL